MHLNADGNQSFTIPPETLQAGVGATLALADLFKRDKNQFGCTDGQMRRGNCTAYNQWLKQQKEMAVYQQAQDRMMAIQDSQKRQKAKTGIVVGVSVGAIALLLFLLWKFKWSKK